MAWDVYKKDEHYAPFAVNTYNRIHKDMAAKYPDWFKDEEEFQSEANAAEAPATKADISALGGNIVEAK